MQLVSSQNNSWLLLSVSLKPFSDSHNIIFLYSFNPLIAKNMHVILPNLKFWIKGHTERTMTNRLAEYCFSQVFLFCHSIQILTSWLLWWNKNDDRSLWKEF